MHKLKLKIIGMNCQACVQTIEEKLSGVSGILTAKVNYESRKAVIMYDQEKIKAEEIRQMIKSVGSFDSEQITDVEEPIFSEVKAPVGEATPPALEQPVGGGNFSKVFFWNGLLTSVSIVSIIINIILVTNLYKLTNTSRLVTKAQAVIPSTQPTANNPTPTPPVPSTPQSFTITKSDHIRGNYNAPITLVEFSDFECPYCGRAYPTLKKILADYKDQVRLVYKHFPLSFHPNAQKAAEASECADEQGKFWEYHDKLFDNQPGGYSLDKFKSWAKDLGLKEQQFNDCLDSDKYAQKVATDQQEGQTKGVQGTPATFVNGQLVSGAVPYENFKQIIDSLINKK